MKRYHTVLILLLSSLLLWAGCTDESIKEGGKVSLRISAVIPAMTDSLVTRADEETGSFQVALSTTANEYAGVAKTYTATGSGNSYSFSPATTDGDLKVALLATTIPLTLYGQVGNIPYYYSNANTVINRGTITDLKLTYAYAKVAVRIQKAGKTETTETYTVSSNLLTQPAVTGSAYNWTTTGAVPQLTASIDYPSTTNIEESNVSNIDFTQVGMAVTPVTVSGSTDKLFILTETATSAKTYNVSSLSDGITIEAGKAYLFTVDLDKGAVITQTDITAMNKSESEFRYPPAIYSLKDLKDFRDAWNTNGESGFNSNAYIKWFDESTGVIKLLIDIDLNNESWTPINDFTGVFDGDNHTISNLTVNNGNTDGTAGLFGNIKASTSSSTPAEIRNLNIKNATISAAGDCGVICGKSDNSRITGCNISGVVVVNSSSGNAGGIVGNVTSSGSWLQRCNVLCADESTITGSGNAGGIVGNTAVDVFGCVVNNISAITATSVGSIAGTGANGAKLNSCIACNIPALTGTGTKAETETQSSLFGNATTSNCFFMNVAGGDVATEGHVGTMEYLRNYCYVYNYELRDFYTNNSSAPYDAQYKFVSNMTSSLPPTMQEGDPRDEERVPGIYNAAELVEFSTAWNNQDATEIAKYRTAIDNTVRIMKYIDMKGQSFGGIGNISGYFIGLDGEQQTIANLSGVSALIPYPGTLTLKDLILKDAKTTSGGFVLASFTPLCLEYCRRIGGSVSSTSRDNGGLVGYVSGYSRTGVLTCIACSVEGMSIEGKDGNSASNSGGLMGLDYGKTGGVTVGCAVINTTIKGNSNVGGLLGGCYEYSNMYIQSCIVYNNTVAKYTSDKTPKLGILIGGGRGGEVSPKMCQ